MIYQEYKNFRVEFTLYIPAHIWRLLVPLWWPHLAQDQFCTTREVRVGHGGSVVVKKDPCQTEFQFCRVPRIGGIKLQLLCGVRIELAVGSLPYPRFSLDSNCLVEGG